MDFLRGLAPPRDGDLTRAVAVLPSRFAVHTPLSADAVRSDRSVVADIESVADDASVAAIDAAFEGVRRSAFALPGDRHALPAANASAAVEPPGIATDSNIRPASMPSHGEVVRDAGPAQRVPQRRELEAGTRATPPQRRADARSVATAVLSKENASAARLAEGGPDRTPSRPGDARAPLSEATVAQRRLGTRDASIRVHVSIGRIEVIAASAPKPSAARRDASPRQGAVALADYLARAEGGRT